MKSFSILRTSLALSGAAALLLSPSASAQSFNIDFADNLTLGTPSNTYGAGSGISSAIGPQVFQISTSVQTDKTAEALVEIKSELEIEIDTNRNKSKSQLYTI